MNIEDLALQKAQEMFLRYEIEQEQRRKYFESKGVNPKITNPYYDDYQKQKINCMTTMESYDLKTNEFHKVGCHCWECWLCRKNMKKKLFHEILPLTLKYNIWRHLVITVKPKEYREKDKIEQSYIDTKKAFKKLKEIIKYTYGKDFTYIAFWRAQRTGCCHVHLLIDRYIDLKWLIEKTKKYPVFGTINITKNQDSTHYLINDFYKDPEWYIPRGQRHYTTSRNIKIQKNKCDGENKIVYKTPRYSYLPEIKNIQQIRFYEKIIKLIEKKTGTTVPNEMIFKQYENNFEQQKNKDIKELTSQNYNLEWEYE